MLEALDWDKSDNLNKPPSQKTSRHLQDLIKAIVSCGVSFNIWEKTDADGKRSGLYDFTSLMGSDKKLLLQSLPDKLKGILKPETSETVIQIWKVKFLSIFLFTKILSFNIVTSTNSRTKYCVNYCFCNNGVLTSIKFKTFIGF